MAAIAHGGRFASLPIEDDRERQVKKIEVKDVDKSKKKKKKKKGGPDEGLQTMIFGGAKSKPLHYPALSPSSPPENFLSAHTEFNQKQLKQDEAATDELSSDMTEALLQSELQFKLEQESKEEEVKSKVGVSLQTAEILPDTPTPQTDDVFTPKTLPPVTSKKIDSDKKEADLEGGEFKEIKRKAKKVKSSNSTSTFQHLPLVVDLNPTPIKVIELEKKLTEANKEICELVISKKDMLEEIDILKEENQSISHLLSQAELRKKADMVQEIEGLNLEKVEMTEELERMNEAIEQERTRAKNLRTELQRYQNKK